jgi:DNA-directed RNA polymerase beta subunit
MCVAKKEALQKLTRISKIVYNIKNNKRCNGKIHHTALLKALNIQSKEILTIFQDSIYKDINASVQGDWGDYQEAMDKALKQAIYLKHGRQFFAIHQSGVISCERENPLYVRNYMLMQKAELNF